MGDTEAGWAARALHHAEREAREAGWRTERTEGFFARRKAHKEEIGAQQRLQVAKERWGQVGEPAVHRLDQEIAHHRGKVDELVAEWDRRAAYRAAHPELARRSGQLWGDLRRLDGSVNRQRDELDGIKPPTPEQLVQRLRRQAQLSYRQSVDQGVQPQQGMGMEM